MSFGRIMKTEPLENIVTTRTISGRKGKRRNREKILEDHKGISSIELIHNTNDSSVVRHERLRHAAGHMIPRDGEIKKKNTLLKIQYTGHQPKSVNLTKK